MPIKPRSGDFSIFIDEKEDIYINCISGFGYLGMDAGFLRIKKGETDFDTSCQFKITQTIIEGEEHKVSYLIDIKYVGNGINTLQLIFLYIILYSLIGLKIEL